MEENQDPSKRRKLYDIFMAGPSSASSSSKYPFKKSTSLPENETFSFIIQLGPASTLKHAIGALSNVDFNKSGMAMIEFEEKAVEINVCDFRHGTSGYLDLKEGFILYCFGTPLRKMISLFWVSQFLNGASDCDVVTIWHTLESKHQLWFEFGDGIKPFFKFPLDLVEIDAKFQKAPKNPLYFCELCLSMETLSTFITLQEANAQKLVYFNVSSKEATMTVGGEVMKYTEEGLCIRGMFSVQKHFALFHWPYCESLKRASFLAQGFYFYLTRIPSTCIMWKFKLDEQLKGDLVISTDMGVFKPNTQEGKSTTVDPKEAEMLQLINKSASLNI